MKHRHILLAVLITLGWSSTFAMTVTVSASMGSLCGQPTGYLSAYVDGGIPPYTYSWSTGAISVDIGGLTPGTYQLTVTDYLGETATGSGQITLLNSYDSFTSGPYFGCPGSNGRVLFYAGTENGMPPDPQSGSQHAPGPYQFQAQGYTLQWQELASCDIYSYYDVEIEGSVPGNNITVTYTDGAGCPGSFQYSVPNAVVLPAMQMLNSSGSCAGANNGSVTIAVGAAGANEALVVRMKDANGEFVGGCIMGNPVQTTPSTMTFTNLAAGTYYAMINTQDYGIHGTLPLCRDSVEVVINELPGSCGLVNGRIFVDNNGNCSLNGGENNVPNTVVEITPGPYYTTTNSTGQFSVLLPHGTYSFAEQHPVLVQSCPADLTLSSGGPVTKNIACAPGDPLDLNLSISSGPARPGFQMNYALLVSNLTPSVSGDVTLTMTYDPVLGYISANPAPTSIAGNTLTWTAPALTLTSAFQERMVHVKLQIPPDVGLLGSTLSSSAEISSVNTDVDLSNNSVTSTQLVTGSYDPNDKLAETSTGASDALYFIDQDEWIDYTIRFQNTGTDTAFSVVVTDTLPASLDPAMIIWGASSHANSRLLEGAGILKFIFPNIMLPDSNVNEPASNGFVSFRIRPHAPVMPGTVISNIANIYFDYNDPVITDPSVLVAEFSTNVAVLRKESLHIAPNPVSDLLHVYLPADAKGTVVVRSADGRVVQVPVRSSAVGLELDVRALANGLYVLQHQDRTVRFIKQ